MVDVGVADAGAALLALQPWQFVMVGLVTLLGSIMAGLSGIGGGMLLALAIAPVVGVKPLVPIVAVAMFVNHLFRVSAFRRSVQWRTALLMSAAAVPATVLGAVVYVALPAKAVAIVIGGFVLIFVVARRFVGQQAWRLSPLGLAGVATVFGVLSGATVGSGMIIVPVLLGHGLSGATLIGTDAVLGLAVIMAKTATFGSLDILTPAVLIFGITMGVASGPGIYMARWIINHTTVKVHTLIVEAMMVVGAFGLLWQGLKMD